MRRTQLAGLLCCLLVWCLLTAPVAHATPILFFPASDGHPRPHVSVSASPSCLDNPAIGSKVWTVAISGTLALLGYGQALTILDVSDPSRPTCRSHLALPPNGSITAIKVRGNYAYLALINSNESDVALQIVDVHDPVNPTLLGSFNGSYANDLEVVGNLVYLTASDLKIVDVSDPAAPALVNTYAVASPYKIQIVGNRLYVSTGTYVFEILDLADPIHPVRLGGFYEGAIGWATFSISGNRAYLLKFAGGVDVLDIDSPNNPLLLGTYTNIDFLDGHFHPITRGFQVIDNRLYIADTRFQLYDVSSPTKAILIGSYDAPGAGYDMWLAGDLAYVANPEKGLQTGDYGFEIIDLSDEANPFLRGWFLNSNTGRFFYVQPIRG